MIGPLIGVILGVFISVVVLAEWVAKLRFLRKSVRVPGVYVGTRDASDGPNVHKRAAYFSFTTLTGITVTSESAVQSFPGPKVGKTCTVLYDPDCHTKAETAGRFLATCVFFLPLGTVLGGWCVLANVLDLLAAQH